MSRLFRFPIVLLALAAAAQAAGPAPAATTAPGAFNWGQRYYFPQGCLRNGSTAICSFQMVNQGPQATVTAWNGNGPYSTGELKGLQFIDNGNVPHVLANAYFRNRFGDTVPTLVVQTKDQVTWVAEFTDVNPAVTTGFFVLGNQTLANIAVSNPPPVQMAAPTGVPVPNAGGAPAPAANPAGPQAPAPAAQAAAPAAQPAPAQTANSGLPAECQNPATMNTAACRTAGKLQRTNDKVNAAGAAVQTTATTVNSLAETARGLKSLFGSKKEEPVVQAVPQQQAAAVPPAPQVPVQQPATAPAPAASQAAPR